MTSARLATAPLKYVVGIDIAKDTFVACFGCIDTSQHLRFGKETTFANTAAGFAALLAWTAKQQPGAAPAGLWSRRRASTTKSWPIFWRITGKR